MISRLYLDEFMSMKGIKLTSSVITISGQTGEAVVNTMAEEQVSLNLDILSREVLLVYAVDMNPSEPDAVAATNTGVSASLSATTRTTIGSIADTNVLAAAQKTIRAAGFLDGGVSFDDRSPETPTAADLPYIGIISTNDFFVQIQSFQGINAGTVDWRIWCARAVVTADIYAALVQGESLSA